jgi:hypothetical protein
VESPLGSRETKELPALNAGRLYKTRSKKDWTVLDRLFRSRRRFTVNRPVFFRTERPPSCSFHYLTCSKQF